MVAVAIGKLDALFFALGIFIGVFIFGDLLYPVIEKFYFSGSMDKITLPAWLHVNAGLVAFAVVVIGVGSFWLAEKAERDWDPYKRFQSRPQEEPGA